MMANLNSKSFSMLFLTISLLLGTQTANAQPGINPFCKTATSKQLCTTILKGATNQRDAVANAINEAILVANKIQGLAPLVVEATAGLDSTTKSEIIQDCNESFANTLEDLNFSIEMLNKGDMGGVATRLSAAYDSNCAASLKERGVHIDAMDKLNDNFGKLMDNALAVAFPS